MEPQKETIDMTLANWITDDELVGRRVFIITSQCDDGEEATVVGVHPTNTVIRVRTDDGEILIGNQWDDI